MCSLLITLEKWYIVKQGILDFFKEIGESKEEFEDTKEVIRICTSKNKHHNGQKKKYKRTNNNLQNIQWKLTIK